MCISDELNTEGVLINIAGVSAELWSGLLLSSRNVQFDTELTSQQCEVFFCELEKP